jgi:hypothetical protein
MINNHCEKDYNISIATRLLEKAEEK